MVDGALELLAGDLQLVRQLMDVRRPRGLPAGFRGRELILEGDQQQAVGLFQVPQGLTVALTGTDFSPRRVRAVKETSRPVSIHLPMAPRSRARRPSLAMSTTRVVSSPAGMVR